MEDLQIIILAIKSVSCRATTSPEGFATILVRHVKRLSLSSSNLNWRSKVRELKHLPSARSERNIRDLGPCGHSRFKSNHSSWLSPHLHTKRSCAAAYSVSSR